MKFYLSLILFCFILACGDDTSEQPETGRQESEISSAEDEGIEGENNSGLLEEAEEGVQPLGAEDNKGPLSQIGKGDAGSTSRDAVRGRGDDEPQGKSKGPLWVYNDTNHNVKAVFQFINGNTKSISEVEISPGKCHLQLDPEAQASLLRVAVQKEGEDPMTCGSQSKPCDSGLFTVDEAWYSSSVTLFGLLDLVYFQVSASEESRRECGHPVR